ncbi:MAG: MFS transporter [Rhodospirillaceae bacterium]|nr:MFS transporter [Rhodospirillaceae bacterium]
MTRESSWRPGIAFGAVLGIFAAFQQFKLPPALPLLLDLYGYDRLLAGGFMSVYALLGLVFSVRIGGWLDRYGSGRMLLIASAIMFCGNLGALAMPESGALVLVSRGFEGFAFAIFAIAGPVIANASAEPRHLPLVFALTAAWIPVGQISAALIGQPIIGAGAWRPLWWIAAAATLGMAIWVAALGRRLGRTLAGAGSKRGPTSRTEVLPVLNLALIGVTFTLWAAQYFAFVTWLPTYLVEVLGFAPGDAVLGYLLPVALLLVFVLACGGLMRLGIPIPAMLLGSLFLQAAVWWWLPSTESALWAGIGLVAWAAGAGTTPTCLFAMPSVVLGTGRAGPRAFAIVMTGRNLGVLVGPLLIPAVLALGGHWSFAGSVFGALTLGAGFVAALLSWRLRQGRI